jgi:hypothetical protein
MITDWLVGIGSVLGGGAAVWTAIQSAHLKRQDVALKELQDQTSRPA